MLKKTKNSILNFKKIKFNLNLEALKHNFYIENLKKQFSQNTKSTLSSNLLKSDQDSFNESNYSNNNNNNSINFIINLYFR